MPKITSYDSYLIPAAGATKTYDCNIFTETYSVKATGGTVALAAAMTFNTSGTPVLNSVFTIYYGGGVTSASALGNKVTFFGTDLTDAQALQPLTILAIYNGTWDVRIILDDNGAKEISGAEIIDATIPNSALTDGTIALTKLANLTRGNIVVGNATAIPTATSFKTSGYIGIGDGTDYTSKAVSGDVTISSAGVTTIGVSKVTAAMLNFKIPTYLEASLSLTSAQIQLLYDQPLTIVAAPGAGYYIDVISAEAQTTFVSAAYTTHTALWLQSDTGVVPMLQDTAALLSTVSKITKFQSPTATTAGQTQIIANKALQIFAPVNNPAVGDGTIKISVLYRIVTV